MIILYNPRSTRPRNRRLPLSVLALAAVLEGREEYEIVDGNLDDNPTGTASDTNTIAVTVTDDDAGSDIPEARCVGQVDTDSERGGDRRQDGVAGAGDIVDLPDFGALNMGCPVGRN